MKSKGASLTLKIFLSTALVVVIMIGGNLALATRQAQTAANESVDRVLASAREALNAQLAGDASGLLQAAVAFAEQPGFRATVEAGKGTDVLDQAEEAATTLRATWVQITDGKALRLAKSDDKGAEQVDMGASQEIVSALNEESVSGFGVSRDSLVVQLASVPIFGSGRVVGAMLAARAIDDDYVAQVKMKAAGGLEVVFYTTDRNGEVALSASTLGHMPEVVEAVRPLLAAPADSAMTRVEREIGGVHYVGLAGVLRSSAGDPAGGYLMLRNRDAEFAGFAKQRQYLLLSGGIGILIAALLALFNARQITRPVAKLVVAAKRAADGDYAADIPLTSRDEIGTLAAAFRSLLGDLREKQQLVEFLSSAEQAKTVQMRAMSATTEQRIAGVGLTPGSKFAGRYEVKEILGEGGMGTVFKAVDTELGEVIAVKTLKQDFLSQDSTALERFKSEIRLARRISHRNVVRTHDLGENSGIYYITMEYVEGKSLKDLIKSRGRLPVPITLSVGKQLARALEIAHEQGVIHRDIKPQNMVVEANGVLKVMDFGIARLATRKPESGMTQQGMIVGTPEYMAPEQLSGEDVDHRVDIYAAGCVLYECVTGKPPFTADTPYQLVAKMLEETAPSPRTINGEVPPPLDALIMSALAKDAAQRPQTALALHDALARIG